MNSNILYEKLFVKDRFFTIAIQKRKNESILERMQFTPEYIVPANRSKWVADPILVDAGEKTYLFYEAVLNNHGHIEVAEIKDNCALGKPVIILKDEYHYSYPFVFNYNKKWYMIPESSDASEVRLYYATDFPKKWKMVCVLLQEKAVDTTVFEMNGKLYLLTFFLMENSERVTPHIYELNDIEKEPQLKEILWEDYNELRVRGAGAIFKVSDKLYRPAQVNKENRYGDAIVFYQVDLKDSYHEIFRGELTARDLLTTKYYVDGLHTYNMSQKYEVIDIRCAVLDYCKLFHKIRNLFVR